MIDRETAGFSLTPVAGDSANCARHLKKVNHYVLSAKLGTGSGSSVYLVIDEITGQRYAMKRFKLSTLSNSSNGLAQLEHEIRMMRLLKHPNIVRFVEILYASSSDEAFLILEYADRGSLATLIEKRLPLSLPNVFSIVKQIAKALKYLHDTGYVHEDVNPANVLLDSSGRALLADLGVGHSFQSPRPVVSSPAHQAPELFDDGRDIDPDDEPQKEDVWALGVTLYQMLFGRLPFRGSTLFEIVSHVKAHPLALPAGTDAAVARLLRGMLAVDPAARWSVAAVLAHPLVRDAPDAAPSIPDAAPSIPDAGEASPARAGRAVELCARVCPDGWSFAGCGGRAARLLSWRFGATRLTMEPQVLSAFL
jgi:serine/threonine-protein kinase 11